MKPAYLQAGDEVAIVAPARKIDQKSLDTAQEVLRSWGLKVVLGSNVYSEYGYFAGTDEERLSDLQEALDSPRIKAIFCARGGYGMTRIVDRISFDEFMISPKWVVGFSDITALHLKLARLEVESIHGVMPLFFNPNADPATDSLRSVLFGTEAAIEYPRGKFDRCGKASGQLVGGNLSLIVDSLGTSNEIETEGRILYVEEIDEYLYKVDRMLVQLKRSGKLRRASAVIVGHMSYIKDTQLPFGKSVEEIFLEHTEEYGYPVAFDFPFGHEKRNLAIPNLRQAEFEVGNDKSVLRFI
ncbi:MAG: LD-carboxypeptidase [Bacteroidota bacterium]